MVYGYDDKYLRAEQYQHSEPMEWTVRSRLQLFQRCSILLVLDHVQDEAEE